jgi:hypothetical protein
MGVAGRDRFHRIERALHKPRAHQDEVDLTVLAMRRPPREQCEQDPLVRRSTAMDGGGHRLA